MDWSTMRVRLHAAPGFGGDENRDKRKNWIAAALGYEKYFEGLNLFTAYQRADAEQLAHVEQQLALLERP